MSNRQRRVAVTSRELRAVVAAVFAGESAGAPDVTVSVVDDAAIAELNERFLAHAGPTDAIAFSYADDPAPDGVRGEVVVSAETARREARARGLDPREELLLYVAHGTLHLLGWDDDTPARRRAMNRRARAHVAAARRARRAVRGAPAARRAGGARRR